MTISPPVNKLETREQQSNARTDQDYFDIVSRMGSQIIRPGGLVTFKRKNGGALYISAGVFGGARLEGTRQVVSCSPGTEFTKTVIVNGSVLVKGAFFVCEGNTPAIVVEDGGSLTLVDCFISKAEGVQTAASDRYITVETGGFGTFSNCGFFGDQAAVGTVITNEDALNPARVAVVGGMNYTNIVAASRYTNVGYIQDIAIV
jgi:hypothetical protein